MDYNYVMAVQIDCMSGNSTDWPHGVYRIRTVCVESANVGHLTVLVVAL